ncbi:CHASE3 domain-containing protein, partial [Pedobacter sp.]|uniref:CHASE3 domain-containing protein n=1 Tax=Pedobacter sp. TaxID=1411316 RepID=UPI002B56EC8C
MKKTIKNNLRIGLGLSLLVLFVSSSASYFSIRNLIRNSELVAHSNDVISNLDNIISTLKDAETGQRGYLLTGEKVFLEPYTGAKTAALDLVNEVMGQTRDNDFQQKNIKRLQDNIEHRMDILDKTISIKNRGGSVSMIELLNGKLYMDNARALIKTMQVEEKRLLEERTANLN